MLRLCKKKPKKIDDDREKWTAWHSPLFYKLGRLIGLYPGWYAGSTIFVALMLSLGLYNFGEINDIVSQFTPTSSPSLRERELADHFNLHNGAGKVVGTYVFVEAKDAGSLLRPPQLISLISLLLKFQTEVYDTLNGIKFNFETLCGAGCTVNDALFQVLSFLNGTNDRAAKRLNITITYPTTVVGNMRIYLGDFIYGVETDRNRVLLSAKMIVLTYTIKIENEEKMEMFKIWEKRLYVEAERFNSQSEFLTLTYLDPTLVFSEIRRTGMSALPYLSLSFSLGFLFAVTSSIRSSWRESNVLEAAVGVLGPILAIVSASGLLIGFSISYQPIVVVSFFLVVAIGVDDIFVILHAWHASDRFKRDPVERMARTLRMAGPSITITSLTDMFSFAVGTFCSTPAIKTFCTFASVEVLFTYIIQITLFCPTLVLRYNRLQEGGKKHKNLDGFLSCVTGGAKQSYRDFVANYSKLITHKATAVFTAFCLLGYWTSAIYGWTKLTTDLNTDKLFLKDSPVLRLRRIEKEYLEVGAGQVTVFVFDPGNLKDRRKLDESQDMVKKYETADAMQIGPLSTFFWLRPYTKHLAREQKTDPNLITFNYYSLPGFLNITGHQAYMNALQLDSNACHNNRPQCISAYSFSTGFIDAKTWPDKVELLKKWRNIAEQYTYLNVSTYYTANFICDQVSSVRSLTRDSVLATILCMVVVCLLLIPHLASVVSAVLSVLSINVGVVGYLALWNVQLDPIAMAAFLMAIGFSVDFTAHISFHYHHFSATESGQEKMRCTLEASVWPMLQGALSTLLCAGVLAIHESYLIMTFVKTVVAVIGLGLLHGLFVLPVILNLVTFCRAKKRRKSTVVTPHAPIYYSNYPPTAHISRNGRLKSKSVRTRF